MGQELAQVRGQALRASATLRPSRLYLDQPEYQEPHRRGEVLVAAVLHAFLDTWRARLTALDPLGTGWVDRLRTAEEGADIAAVLLTMLIRAIDYLPPVHVTFGDFLSAALTADHEIRAADGRYRLRAALRKSFAAFGIEPASRTSTIEPGLWGAPDAAQVRYDRVHLQALTEDREEVFRFLWDNRQTLRLDESTYTRVLSVRRCLRIDPEGFSLRETVAECLQMITLRADELASLRIAQPTGMPADTEITLYGGMTLVFGESGRLKYVIGTRINNSTRQSSRLQSLWERGYFDGRARRSRHFWQLHRRRSGLGPEHPGEEW